MCASFSRALNAGHLQFHYHIKCISSPVNRFSLIRSQWACSLRHKSGNERDPKEIEVDQPVKYSSSKASTWTVRNTYGVKTEEERAPDAQAPVIVISLAVLMIYFCYLREENDLDEQLQRSLYDHVDGLEEVQLRQSLEYNSAKGLDTTALQKRLAEIQKH